MTIFIRMLNQQLQDSYDRPRHYYSAKCTARAHNKSIHAIAPSKINPSTYYGCLSSTNNCYRDGYVSGATTARSYLNTSRPHGLKQNLFVDNQ